MNYANQLKKNRDWKEKKLKLIKKKNLKITEHRRKNIKVAKKQDFVRGWDQEKTVQKKPN